MAPDSGLEEKMQDAKSILLQCVGEDGIWADATRDGYKNIYFTRDLAIAAEGLVAAGLEEHVQKHLNSLAIRQGEDGGIPVFFIGNYRAWALQKLRRAFIDGELLWMIMKKLNNYFPNFVPKSMGATHDTTDSELQYIDAVVKYARLTGDTEFLQAHHGNMKAAFQFSQSRVKDGLYRGVDWRDNVRFPPDVALLSNNALLVRAYKALNLSARTLKERINDQFWNGEYHTDQPNVKDFDAFGQALAVLNDIPTAGQYTNIARKFESLVTNVGIKANDLACLMTCEAKKEFQLNASTSTKQSGLL